METIEILSTRPTLLHLPPLVETGRDADGDKVSVESPTSLKPGSHKQPVATTVSAEAWARAKGHKVVQQWLRLGWVKEKPAEVEAPAEAPPPESLAGYAGPASLALVETEQSEKVLRGWLAVEGRAPIREAITKRIAAVASRRAAATK